MRLAHDFVSRENMLLIERYLESLQKWNKKINLVANSTTESILKRHALDSLQLLDLIKPDDFVIDVGSGAGFPGVMLSLGGVKRVILIESDLRKSMFLKHISKLSRYDLSVINDRIELIDNLSCDIIVSRAMTEIKSLLQLTKNIMVSRYIIHKGKNYLQEIELAQKEILFNYKIHDSITSEEGKILEITNVRY